MTEELRGTLAKDPSDEPSTPEATGGAATEDRPPTRNLPPVTERELAARARGLDSAYIPGGNDPELEKTKRNEARWMRLLLLMIVVIVGGAMLVTFVGLIVSAGGGQ
jgi:hypothetical protein